MTAHSPSMDTPFQPACVFALTNFLSGRGAASFPDEVRGRMSAASDSIVQTLNSAYRERGSFDLKTPIFLRYSTERAESTTTLVQQLMEFLCGSQAHEIDHSAELNTALDLLDTFAQLFRNGVVTEEDKKKSRRHLRPSRSRSPQAKHKVKEYRVRDQPRVEIDDGQGLDELCEQAKKLNIDDSSSLARGRSAFAAATRTAVARAVLN